MSPKVMRKTATRLLYLTISLIAMMTMRRRTKLQ
jgi:hypothetical protein